MADSSLTTGESNCIVRQNPLAVTLDFFLQPQQRQFAGQADFTPDFLDRLLKRLRNYKTSR
jgi:hypothetical protein